MDTIKNLEPGTSKSMLLDRENFQYILWHPSDLSSTKSKTSWYLWKFDILGLSPTKTKTCLSKHIVPNEAFVVDIQSIILQEAPEAKKVKSRTNKSNVTFTRCCSFSNEDQNDRVYKNFKMTRAQDCSSLYFSWTSSALAGSHVFWQNKFVKLKNYKFDLFERSSVTVTALLLKTLEFFKTSSRSFKDSFYPRQSDWYLCVTLHAPNTLKLYFSNGFHF